MTEEHEGKASKVADKTFGQVIAKGREYLIGLVITAVAGGIYASWVFFKDEIKTYLREEVVQAVAEDLKRAAVAEDLKAAQSKLAVPILTLLARDRASDVGELNSGHFVLTPSNPTYSAVIYFPNGSEGKVVVSLDGDISRKSYLTVQLPTKEAAERIYNSEGVIEITSKNETSNVSSLAKPQIVLLRAPELKNLQVLTFQYAGPDIDKPPPDKIPSLEVFYTVLISPTIKYYHHKDEQN